MCSKWHWDIVWIKVRDAEQSVMKSGSVGYSKHEAQHVNLVDFVDRAIDEIDRTERSTESQVHEYQLIIHGLRTYV